MWFRLFAGFISRFPDSLPEGCPGSWAVLHLPLSTFLPPFSMGGFATRPLPSFPSRFRLVFVFSVAGWFPAGATISSPCLDFRDFRYYEGSDSCLPSPWQAGISAYSALLSDHPAPNHMVCPCIALYVIFSVQDEFQASPCARKLAALALPNRIRYPAGWSFAAGCSPPRLTATQLPLATQL